MKLLMNFKWAIVFLFAIIVILMDKHTIVAPLVKAIGLWPAMILILVILLVFAFMFLKDYKKFRRGEA